MSSIWGRQASQVFIAANIVSVRRTCAVITDTAVCIAAGQQRDRRRHVLVAMLVLETK